MWEGSGVPLRASGGEIRMCVRRTENTFLKVWWPSLLLSPSLLCSLHDRPNNPRSVEARSMTLFGKPVDQEDGRLICQTNHLIWVWISGSFIEPEREVSHYFSKVKRQNGEGNKVKKKVKRVFHLAKHLWEGPAFGKGCVHLFIFCSHSQVSRVRLYLCELDKGTLV